MERKGRNLYENFFEQGVIDNIRNYRIEKGWSQARLAEAIDVSQEFICSLELEKGKIPFRLLLFGESLRL